MLTTIDHYLNPIEAHIVKGRIEAEGVSAYIQHQHHIWAKWTLSLALGYVKIQVNANDVTAANTILDKLRAGDYALPDDEADVGICPKCSSINKQRVDWSWKLALMVFVFFQISLPYTVHRVRCGSCRHTWTQKTQRAYPLWVIAFAIFITIVGFMIIGETAFYVCKINYLHDSCI